MKFQILPDPEALALAAASFICDQAIGRIAQAGRFSIALSGGSTPALAYQQLPGLAQERGLDWSCVQFFWGDERCVPLHHPQSNYRMARESFLDQIPVPTDNLYPMACEDDPGAGAERYEELLRSYFADQPFPGFDLILLGLGEDGHTASLFPDTPILEERVRWVAPVYVPRLASWRISLTLPAINSASVIAFLVSGQQKAESLKRMLEPGSQAANLPAAHIQPQGDLHFFIDRSAGSLLGQSATPSA